jgi:hypothetical protein
MGKYILPFDTDIGYPQQIRFKIAGVAYIAYIRRANPISDTIAQEEAYLPWIRYILETPYEDAAYTVIRIVRIRDTAEVLLTRLCELSHAEARDPATHEVLLTLFPHTLDETTCEIWVMTT